MASAVAVAVAVASAARTEQTASVNASSDGQGSMVAAAARAKARAASRTESGGGGGMGFGGRFQRSSSLVDREVEEDVNKSRSENARAFLRVVVENSSGGGGVGVGVLSISPSVLSSPQGKARKVANLNALAKMWEKRTRRRTDVEGGASATATATATSVPTEDEQILRVRELMVCLRIPLVHDSVEVRATALRTIRCVMTNADDVRDANLVNMQHLIARCMDLDLDNQIERLQALRLARKILFLAPAHFPKAIVRSLVSIADGDHKETDRLKQVSLAVLCELSVMNSDLFVACNGVSVLTHALLEVSMPRIAEAILGSLLRLQINPVTRAKANVSLDLVVAPFTEFHYVHNDDSNARGGDSSAGTARGDREHRFQCAYQVILSLLRSWTGLIHLANPKIRKAITPLQAVVDTLYLPNPEIRMLIMNLFLDALCLRRPPTDADTYVKALDGINPSSFKEGWRLAEGFVASEGLDILPHLTKTRPNLLDTHRALMLNFLLRAKLPDALVRVIVTSPTPQLSIAATVLLGEFLYLTYLLLPRELNMTGHCLPSLLAEVASSDPLKSNRASEAVTALQSLHAMKKTGPVAHSLFLDQILEDSGCFQGESFAGDRIHSPNWQQLVLGSSADEKSMSAISESKVLESKDATTWDWDVLASVFRYPPSHTLDGSGSSSELQTVRQFVKRVSDFFKPSNNLFAKVELKLKRARYLTKIGCLFCDFLVRSKSPEGTRFLDDFVIDITNEINLFLSSTSPPQDCLLSPTRIATTVCQYYFLFLGRLSRTPEGRAALDRQQVLHCLYELLAHRTDLYFKLVVASLDYSSPEWGSRNLLSKALKEGSEYTRLYATRFIGVLIRSRTQNIAQWGISLLVMQLSDKSSIIPWVSLDLLAEACDDKMNLEAVICAMKDADGGLDSLGLKGVFLRTQFLASGNGFKLLRQTGFLDDQLRRWRDEYNERYVTLVEEMLNDGFSHHQKNEERVYGRRSHEAHTVRNVYLPPHLYGQLASTEKGFKVLSQQECLYEMFALLRSHNNGGAVVMGEQDISALKTAMWAVCNVATSPEGAAVLERENILPAVVGMAERSAYFSLRGTAIYALSLVATTRLGTRMLTQVGWCSLRFCRGDKWPVLEEWFANQLVTVRMEYEQMAAANAALYDEDYPVSSPLELDEDDEIDTGIGVVGETDRSLSFSYSPGVTTGTVSSAPAGARTGLSGRKRFGDMFRSFSLGKNSSSSGAGGESGGSMRRRRGRGRRIIFRQSASLDAGDEEESQRTSSGGGDGSSPRKLEDVGSDDVTAPIATPDGAEDLLLKDIDEENKGDGVNKGRKQQQQAEDTTSPKQQGSDSTSGVSSASGSLQINRGTSAAALPPMKLSPIASSASISTQQKRGGGGESKEEPTPTTITLALRSGHRCVSESEAQTTASPYPQAQQLQQQQLLVPGQSVTSMSSVGSWTDNPGYMTLRSIHNRRRPPLSLSHSTEQDPTSIPALSGSGGDRDPRGSTAQVWAKKSRSLDYRVRRGRPRLPSGGGVTLPRSEGTSSLPHRPSVMVPLMEETVENPILGGHQPRYRGVTLPFQMDVLFPEGEADTSLDPICIPVDKSDQRLKAANNKVDDWLQSHPTYHGLELHTVDSCLACFSLDLVGRDGVGVAFGAGGVRPRLGSFQMGIQVADGAAGGSLSNQGSPLLMRRFRKGSDIAAGGATAGAGSLLMLDEDQFSLGGSTHSLRSDGWGTMGAGATGGGSGANRALMAPSDSIMAKLMQRKEVLKLIGYMNATVGMSTAESGLLKLKQRFPAVFQDLCLYSEVCLLLASRSFRLSARRFIQELFMDLQYREMYDEPRKILCLTEEETSATMLSSHQASSTGAALATQLHLSELPERGNSEEEEEDE